MAAAGMVRTCGVIRCVSGSPIRPRRGCATCVGRRNGHGVRRRAGPAGVAPALPIPMTPARSASDRVARTRRRLAVRTVCATRIGCASPGLAASRRRPRMPEHNDLIPSSPIARWEFPAVLVTEAGQLDRLLLGLMRDGLPDWPGRPLPAPLPEATVVTRYTPGIHHFAQVREYGAGYSRRRVAQRPAPSAFLGPDRGLHGHAAGRMNPRGSKSVAAGHPASQIGRAHV